MTHKHNDSRARALFCFKNSHGEILEVCHCTYARARNLASAYSKNLAQNVRMEVIA